MPSELDQDLYPPAIMPECYIALPLDSLPEGDFGYVEPDALWIDHTDRACYLNPLARVRKVMGIACDHYLQVIRLDERIFNVTIPYAIKNHHRWEVRGWPDTQEMFVVTEIRFEELT